MPERYRRQHENNGRGRYEAGSPPGATPPEEGAASRPDAVAASRAPQGAPSFAGRGPKGYRRSDERIREDICERLTEAHDVDAREISVRVSNGQITLSGTVDTREQKRRAEDIAERASGAVDVTNNLRFSSRPS